jgi:uncharacterized protein (TIGR03083 family)
MDNLEPIMVVDLFPQVESKLIELLRELSPTDWQTPTICPQWDVKDIVAHLLDGNLRKLSLGRDAHVGETPQNITTYQDLVDFINRLNADWIRAAKRLSPAVLIHLLEITSAEVYQYSKTLDSYQPAKWAVAWAGEEQSPNWFDLAREYTERWHHQQQIRLAVNKPGITGRDFYAPVLDTFMRALPYAYRMIAAEDGTLITFHILGEAGGKWYLLRKEATWKLVKGEFVNAQAEVFIPQDIAWRIFTKGIDKRIAEQATIIQGNTELGRVVLNMLAVMA